MRGCTKVLVSVLSVFVLISCAGMVPTSTVTPDQESQLGTIKEFPSKSKDELYDLAMQWVARTYNSANDVVQLRDKENGQIICKGIGSAPMDLGIKRSFRYTMIIDVKEGKLRTRYENIVSERVGDTAGPNMTMQWEHVASHFVLLNNNLFAAITSGGHEDDW